METDRHQGETSATAPSWLRPRTTNSLLCDISLVSSAEAFAGVLLPTCPPSSQVTRLKESLQTRVEQLTAEGVSMAQVLGNCQWAESNRQKHQWIFNTRQCFHTSPSSQQSLAPSGLLRPQATSPDQRNPSNTSLSPRPRGTPGRPSCFVPAFSFVLGFHRLRRTPADTLRLLTQSHLLLLPSVWPAL